MKCILSNVSILFIGHFPLVTLYDLFSSQKINKLNGLMSSLYLPQCWEEMCGVHYQNSNCLYMWIHFCYISFYVILSIFSCPLNWADFFSFLCSEKIAEKWHDVNFYTDALKLIEIYIIGLEISMELHILRLKVISTLKASWS